MPRFKLNPMVPGNYSFHCPDSRITLNLYRPMADFKEVTPAIARGVVANRLIDLDQAVKTKKHHIDLSDTDLKGVLLNGVQESKKEIDEEKEEVTPEGQQTVPEPEVEEPDVEKEPDVEEPEVKEEAVKTVALNEEVVAETPKKRSRAKK